MTITPVSGLLLDTSIVVYLQNETTWKNLYAPIIKNEMLFISFMTLAELLEGAYRRCLSNKNIFKFQERLHQEYTILPFTEQICDYFGKIRPARKSRPISVSDALIAATAMTYDLSLVTHNRIDFDGISPELKVVSRYQPPV